MTGEPISNRLGLEKPQQFVPPKPRGSGRVWYKPNNRSFGAFIKSEQMRDVTEEVAMDISVAATISAPPPSPDTDPEAAGATYSVRRNAGLVRVSGNLRVSVEVIGRGLAAERAEFGHAKGDRRYRNLASTGSRFGDWKPPQKED